ncbi:histidinol-phosphate transaminase [Anaerocolumna sp. AGMB13025]|uniref:pyridoxal phosphate-dependent aminotransferase n=1 Tax=Anaerocolumna sp. AGMB13025 TaxID=3039116 RepID=UPI00242017BA|nr:histidinol-phosphate transaminase [Anaerocolumna sp. AGMB13025]WFR56091.1 histidinol-phosphate transaminase [Anaerocolumna sp. AGMB13025]
MEQKLYRHGGEIYDKEITWDFSVNTNPFGLPEGVKDALIKHMEEYSLYPDNCCTGLITALSDYEEINRNYIICGNGASDLIFRLCYAIKPKKAMVTAPSFSEYEKALKEVGCELEYAYLTEAEDFLVTERLLEELNETLDLLFLCNPNNPTGALISPGLLKDIIKYCHKYHIFLVMDECFLDFTDEAEAYSVKKYLEGNDKIFLLKAFTKIYAMAGIRLGYGLCSSEKLLRLMSAMGPAWNVSIPAQVAGIQALKEESYRLKSKDLISEEKIYLYESLRKLGLKVFKPAANYLFFKCRESLYDWLLGKGILIRQCDNYHGLTPEYFRIAVKKHKENEILIKAITEYKCRHKEQ